MKIRLPQLNKTLSAKKGDNLFHTLREQGIALASSCRGDGVCGKCVVNVVSGSECLSAATELEDRLMTKYNYVTPQRISCQCVVEDESEAGIELKTTYW